MQIPIPKLGLGLNLSKLPPASAKREQHTVLLCVPYSTYSNETDFDAFKRSVESKFGIGATVTKLSSKWVVEGNNASETAIPSLTMVDSAYQELGHTPELIENANSEIALLTQQIEQTLSEIQTLDAKKNVLITENSTLRQKIANEEERSRSYAAAAEAVQREYDAFCGKFAPKD